MTSLHISWVKTLMDWVKRLMWLGSKQTFGKVDNAIFWALWQWAKRGHPNKSSRWIKNKYFHHIKGRNWVFCAQIIGKEGKPSHIALFHAASTPIKIHVKIKGQANPYDPQWEIYFEERLGIQMLDNLKERKRLLSLWFEQEGNCPICSQKITKETGWNIHHILKRTDGGKDTMDNLLLLHPNCHRQVHNQELGVSKPRLVKRALAKA